VAGARGATTHERPEFQIAVMPGEGIGPEVMKAALAHAIIGQFGHPQPALPL